MFSRALHLTGAATQLHDAELVLASYAGGQGEDRVDTLNRRSQPISMMPSLWNKVELPDDPRLDLYRDLKDADLRKRGNRFIAEGELVVRKALERHLLGALTIESVLVNQARLAAMEHVLRPLAEEGQAVYLGEQGILDSIAGFHVHRGCLAIGKCPEDKHLSAVMPPPDREAIVVACEALRHVDNLGIVFRNAAAFGVEAVVLDPQSCDPLYRRTLRVSIGHSLTIPWARVGDWQAGLASLRERGFALVALALSEDAQPLHEFAWPARTALLLGSEGPGLTKETLRAADAVLRIPMAKGVDSLNVGTASGIALYAARYRLRASSPTAILSEP